jgi:hypothetical protein
MFLRLDLAHMAMTIQPSDVVNGESSRHDRAVFAQVLIDNAEVLTKRA